MWRTGRATAYNFRFAMRELRELSEVRTEADCAEGPGNRGRPGEPPLYIQTDGTFSLPPRS